METVLAVFKLLCVHPDLSFTCPILTDPANGQVTTTNGNITGSEATYGCKEGFGLSETNVRVCMSDGNWSDNMPICRGK